MKKKLLMILLSAAMIVNMMPAAAFALVKPSYSSDSLNYPIENASTSAAAFAVQGTVGETKIALAWTKVNKAKTYKVYCKKASAQKYKLAKTTKAQKLTLKNLKANTSYKIYVRALSKKGKKLAKTATIRVMTLAPGNAIKFIDSNEEPNVFFDGKIPYDTWGKAVAAGWSFDANVKGEKVKTTLIEYSDNKVGVELPDGTKLGVFYKNKPRYEYNMLKLEDMVDIEHEYVIGDVWPTPAPAPSGHTISFNLSDLVDTIGIVNGTMFVPYDTWSEAAAAGFSFDYALEVEDQQLEATLVLQKNEDGEFWFIIQEIQMEGVSKDVFSGGALCLGICYNEGSTELIGDASAKNTIEDGHKYQLIAISRSYITVNYGGVDWAGGTDYPVLMTIIRTNGNRTWDFELSGALVELKKDNQGFFYAEIGGVVYYLRDNFYNHDKVNSKTFSGGKKYWLVSEGMEIQEFN